MQAFLRMALGAGLVVVLVSGPSTIGQGQTPSASIPAEVIAQIRREAFLHSQVMAIANHLTDVTGPRLTNSPNMRRAQAYARDLLNSWGVHAELERWGPFGRGWAMTAVEVNLTRPDFAPLVAYPKAWSPGTAGPINGQPVFLDAHTPADLERYRGELRGRIVLFSPAKPITPPAWPSRLPDTFLLNLANAEPSPQGGIAFHPSQEQRAEAALNDAKWRLLTAEAPAVVIESSSAPSGSVYVTAAAVTPDERGGERHPWDANHPPVLPQVVMAPEHYNRIVRLLRLGVPASLRVNVAVQFYDDDVMSANVIGELPGTDLRDQIVMFGGCVDSWHTATGATDNASGSAAALEAMRILRALDLHPRRTIRIGLWSAEEQGALGSQPYVSAHFGRRIVGPDGQIHIQQGPEYEKLSGYFNLDWGAGRIRGVYLQGNAAVRPIFRDWLAPFGDLGASTLTLRGIGASDHISFDRIGLPAFQFIRDFWEGMQTQAHTNMDVFDALSADDLEQTAAVMATFVYQAAMRDDKLPRRPGA